MDSQLNDVAETLIRADQDGFAIDGFGALPDRSRKPWIALDKNRNLPARRLTTRPACFEIPGEQLKQGQIPFGAGDKEWLMCPSL